MDTICPSQIKQLVIFDCQLKELTVRHVCIYWCVCVCVCYQLTLEPKITSVYNYFDSKGKTDFKLSLIGDDDTGH